MNKKTIFSILITALIVVLILLLSGLTACKTVQTSNTTPTDNTPASHTVNKGGKLHLTGLYDPETNCVSCHGSDLRGNGAIPSCYNCHGKKW